MPDEQDVTINKEDVQTATYKATVEDIRTNTDTTGLTFTVKDSPGSSNAGDGGSAVDLRLSAKVNDSQTTGTTSTTEMDITYKQSNAVSEKQAITVDGSLNDDRTGFDVRILYDNMFGTFMYEDPSACGSSTLLQCNGAHITQTRNGPSTVQPAQLTAKTGAAAVSPPATAVAASTSGAAVSSQSSGITVTAKTGGAAVSPPATAVAAKASTVNLPHAP
ncbi:MAG: hypothetical protein JO023_07240 [Chloroflexi bacterium]|nr:hypothetical protein [Chloroflexota bacterium]